MADILSGKCIENVWSYPFNATDAPSGIISYAVDQVVRIWVKPLPDRGTVDAGFHCVPPRRLLGERQRNFLRDLLTIFL